MKLTSYEGQKHDNISSETLLAPLHKPGVKTVLIYKGLLCLGMQHVASAVDRVLPVLGGMHDTESL